MEINKKTIKVMLLLITFTIVLFVGLQNLHILLDVINYLWGIIFPFVLGAAIAFIINILLSFYERTLLRKVTSKKLKRPISLLLSIISVIAVIFVIIFLLVPELIRTGITISENIEVFLPEAIIWIEEVFSNPEISQFLVNLTIDWQALTNTVITFFQEQLGTVLLSSLDVAGSIFSGITSFLIAIVFSCYILMQKEKLVLQGKKVLYAFFKEEHAKPIVDVIVLSKKTFHNFITGQCLEALILGTLFFVAMTIFSMPYALLIGVIISITALIPIVGAFIGCFIGVLLIFIQDPTQALIFLVLFLVLQQIEGNFIYPYVVGGSVGLPSIWVLFAITLGGSLLGVAGMLLFIPLMSVLYVLFRKMVYARLKKRKIKFE